MSVKVFFLFFLFFLTILTPLWGLRIEMGSEMALSDFYRQGIYPVRSGQNEIMVWGDPIEFIFSKSLALEVDHCTARFEISTSGKVLLCQYFADEAYPLEEGVEILKKMASQIEIELGYQTFPPGADPSLSGIGWTSAGGKNMESLPVWDIFLAARRAGEIMMISGSLSGPADSRELAATTLEWGSTDFVEAPNEWRHLPLGMFDRGDDPEVRAFTFLVSSYDDEGNLLPEFQKRREEIEKKAAEKVAAREEARRDLERPPRKRVEKEKQPPTESSSEDDERAPWIVASALLLVSALVYLAWCRWFRPSLRP